MKKQESPNRPRKFQQWRIEVSYVGKKAHFERIKMIKEVSLTTNQADTLNQQTETSKKEYVEIIEKPKQVKAKKVEETKIEE